MKLNSATKTITSVIGCTLALGGITHGIFEILQGNKPTATLIIQSISKEYQRWPNGEEAFTVIPNFLVTGIVAILISLIIIYWSVFAIDKKNGSTIFLILFIVLTLVGGGIGHVIFFLPTWGYATRMHKPLSWWKKILSKRIKDLLSKTWKALLASTSITFLLALAISVFGLPGTSDENVILAVCWSILFLALILLNFTYISGFARDLSKESVSVHSSSFIKKTVFSFQAKR